MKEKNKYSRDLIISISALTLAILCVGTLYVRDLLQDSPAVHQKNIPGQMEGSRVDPPANNYEPPLPGETAKVADKDSSELKEPEHPSELKTEEKPEDNPPVQKRVSSNPYGSGNGKLTLYMTCTVCSAIEIFIEGNPAGRLTAGYSGKDPPVCNSGGTLTKELPAGRYHLSARDESGKTHDLMVTVRPGKCTVQEVIL